MSSETTWFRSDLEKGEWVMRKRRFALRQVGPIVLVCVVIAALHADQLRSINMESIMHGANTEAMKKLSSAGWTTKGPDILTPTRKPYVISGLTWYGFETKQY